MSLISQNALRSKKREKKENELEEREPAPEKNGSPLAGAADEFEVDPEPEPKLSKKKKSRKRSRRDCERKEQEQEMKSLESALFGTLYSPPEFGNEEAAAAPDGTEEEEKPALPMFFTDKSGGYEVAVYEEDTKKKRPDSEERKPAWVDEDDEAIEVDIEKVPRLRKLREFKDEKVISGAKFAERLRAQHRKLNPGTDWARLDRKVAASDDESDDGSDVTGDDVLRSNYELVEKSGVKLLPGVLEYSRLVDANAEEQSNGPINSVEFHRNGQLLLAAGLDKKLRFFQVDGKRNTKVQSIFLEDCPIRKASFLPDGSQVIVSGRRKFFYSFDLVKAAVDKIGPLTGREEKSIEVFEVSPDSKTIAFIGNDGYILLVSPRTKELIGTLKMNGTARSLAFVDGGQQLMSSGGDGQVYHWDLRTRRCIHRAVDEGCITGSALCASSNGNLFAAGSSSGIVNIYKRDDFLGGKRKPLKAVENLTTKVDFMKFNHDAQILAICSTMKKNSLKLVHVPSLSVFSNWPAPKFSLQYPRCLDFSPGGGFMAFGNAAGKVLLYKLHHYQKV